jgi:hypothetical protein
VKGLQANTAHGDMNFRTTMSADIKSPFEHVLDKQNETTTNCRCGRYCGKWLFTVVFFASVLSGGPSGARTHDTLLKSFLNNRSENRFYRYSLIVNVACRPWLSVLAAVNFCVKYQRVTTKESICARVLVRGPPLPR